MLNTPMRRRKMWVGWVIGYVLSVGRRWLFEAVTTGVNRPVRPKDKKDKWKERDMGKRPSRLSLRMRMDPMKLPRNLFVDMFSISTV
jgi:hypothetical protein